MDFAPAHVGIHVGDIVTGIRIHHGQGLEGIVIFEDSTDVQVLWRIPVTSRVHRYYVPKQSLAVVEKSQ